MNAQQKFSPKGVLFSRGIEWTDYTWNPIGGCRHDCRWIMPDGKIASCYSASIARRFTRAFPQGFDTHYWRPHLLPAPLNVSKPSRVFLDSMSDLMGAWVPDWQILQVFDACREASWHQFQLLTKNPARLGRFAGKFPHNLWCGFSIPPTIMLGRILTASQQRAMVFRGLDALVELNGEVPIRWISIEPLSFDVSSFFEDWETTRGTSLPLDWAVIGAATNGNKYFQPDPQHVAKVHRKLRDVGAKIFHKGNLVWKNHLEEFPTCNFRAEDVDVATRSLEE
jgi:protein gp37